FPFFINDRKEIFDILINDRRYYSDDSLMILFCDTVQFFDRNLLVSDLMLFNQRFKFRKQSPRQTTLYKQRLDFSSTIDSFHNGTNTKYHLVSLSLFGSFPALKLLHLLNYFKYRYLTYTLISQESTKVEKISINLVLNQRFFAILLKVDFWQPSLDISPERCTAYDLSFSPPSRRSNPKRSFEALHEGSSKYRSYLASIDRIVPRSLLLPQSSPHLMSVCSPS